MLVSRRSLGSSNVLRELKNAAVLEERGELTIHQLMLEPIDVSEYPSSFSYYLTGNGRCDLFDRPLNEALAAYVKRLA